jgi:hypothetical protein
LREKGIALTDIVRKGLWLCVAVSAAAVTGAFGLSGDSAGAAAATDRALTDRPDDISGPQVHFLYVVPSDGADAQLDTSGRMEQSIARTERWFGTKTDNQGLRIDTYNGVPDITFARLPHSNAQVAAYPRSELYVIGGDLVAAGFNDPAKVYAAFYDGTGVMCGGASPGINGIKLGAMYLQTPCRNYPGFRAGTTPGFFEIAILHEVFHALGFTPSCAPHQSADQWRAGPGHVNDDPTDLMYGLDATSPEGWNWENSVLDVNRDDYYRANIPGCADLSNSPYLVPLHTVTVTVSGPGTVTSNPAGIVCSTSCAEKFKGSVTLTATPSAGAVFKGWSGPCTGTASCLVTGEGSVNASFGTSSHRRTLTLRVRAQGVAGALRVGDGYEPCRVGAPVLVERRGQQGWWVVRRARTDRAGQFTVSLPRSRATYRARAPETTAGGQKCVKAVSRTVATGG